MKLEPKQADDEIEIDMSPMIDMVFLLLIFFLVASTVIDEKIDINNIPTAVFAKVDKDQTSRVVVSVNADEEVFFGIDDRPIELEELKLKLKAVIDRSNAADEKLKILIRADGNLKYEMSEKVMKACGEAGATALIYSAFEGAGEAQ